MKHTNKHVLTNQLCELNCHVIKSRTRTGRRKIWHHLNIIKAKPDGHCIIHASTHCLVHQYLNRYLYCNLLRYIRTECSRNRMAYAPIVEKGQHPLLAMNVKLVDQTKYLAHHLVTWYQTLLQIYYIKIFFIEKPTSPEYCVTVVSF